MAHLTGLFSDPPELRRTRNPPTHLPETTLPSPICLSDSEPDIDFDPIFEPFFSDGPHDQPYYPHHHRDFSLMNHHHSFHRSASPDPPGPSLGLGLGSGPGRYGLSGPGEVNLELGLGLASSSNNSSFGEANNDNRNNGDEARGGMRVINLDSDSDSDVCVDELNDRDCNLGFGGVSDFDRPPFCWDYLGFNNNRASNGENNNDCTEMNVSGGGGDDVVLELDRESDDVDTDVSIVFDTYQEREEQREITIESDDDDDDDIDGVGGDFGVDAAIRDLEWEILMAVNNFNREVFDMDFNVDMYEAILGEVEERMNEWRGSPPAAVAVIESLPCVKVLSGKGLKEDGDGDDDEVICAICKDEIVKEEVVRQLPCSHYYHGDCILPWLKLRNTCPVCRYELPTDDADYEFRKREREGEGASAVANDVVEFTLDSQVSSYDFHMFL